MYLIFGILFLILFSLSIVLFAISVFLIFTPNHLYFIVFLMISINCLLLTGLFFKLYTKKFPRNEFLCFKINNVKELIKNENGMNIITFKYENEQWVASNGDKKISMDLKGYLFPKSYIIAYIIRQIRYATVSSRKPIIKIYSMKNDEPKFKNKNLHLQFCYANKKKFKQIIFDGVSKNTFLSYLITNIKLFGHSPKTIAYLENNILSVDEQYYRNIH